MVAIAPFCALRYDPQRVGDLSAAVAPPYDVISPQQQDQLYQRSPYNVVRLILGKEFPTDTPADNRYSRAKQTFEDWRAKGVLVRDEAPALYLCAHTFRWPPHLSSAQGADSPPAAGRQVGGWEDRTYRRLGLLALLEFEGSLPDGVLVHEQTFDAPKRDRAMLMDAVRAHLSPVFCVAPDPQRRMASDLERLSQTQRPLMQVRLSDEEVQVWALTDPEVIQHVRQQMAQAKVLIADGHHRFAVALSRRHLCGAVMAYISWVNDPGVFVHPIHRVLRLAAGSQEPWRSLLRARCVLTPAASMDGLLSWLSSGSEQGRLGYYEAGRWYQARVQDQLLAEWLMHPSVPLALAGLDVVLLHHLLIPEGATLSYTPRASEAAALVDSGQADGAWLLRPVALAQIFALAEQGFTLPHKTTYFYPKVLSGLVINPFDPVS